MPTDTERREVARRLRESAGTAPYMNTSDDFAREVFRAAMNESVGDYRAAVDRLADLMEPSYKPDAEYEAWYNSLSHYGGKRGEPSTICELIEEIVWAALTVDLGPNGNTDPSTGIDEGDVYTNKLFAEWEREALRLSGGCNRDALLALADEMDAYSGHFSTGLQECTVQAWAVAIREALGVDHG